VLFGARHGALDGKGTASPSSSALPQRVRAAFAESQKGRPLATTVERRRRRHLAGRRVSEKTATSASSPSISAAVPPARSTRSATASTTCCPTPPPRSSHLDVARALHDAKMRSEAELFARR